MTHPVLDFAGRERLSRTAAVTELQYDRTEGRSLFNALLKCKQLVDKKVGDRKVAGRFYYITYEVVLDDSGTGRPMQPPVDGQANSVVFTGVPEGIRQAAAA